MTLRVLFSDTEKKWTAWNGHLNKAFKDVNLEIDLHKSYAMPEHEDYIVYSPASPLKDFTPYKNLKAILSMWAGVETVVTNETIQCPLTRMVDPGLTAGMVEYVTAHVLRYHLNLDRHINNQSTWHLDAMPPLTSSRKVGILGLGQLGQACAQSLHQLGFKVLGWSRSKKEVPNVRCFSGPDGLKDTLNQSSILVLLLPNTPETNDLLDFKMLGELPKGASLINPGRGTLIVDEDLIKALDMGQISSATLDVFREEPLPSNHPFWVHPKVTVTPHIAAETRPETAASIIAENIRRSEAGEPLKFVVDRAAGY